MTDLHIHDNRIYYNITIEGKAEKTFARFQEDRTKAILVNPSDYYLTVSRFSIPAAEIPIFICDIVDNQPNPNLTPYTFTIEYNSNIYQSTVIYASQSLSLPTPPSPIPVQVVNTEYYYIYTYSRAITLFNQAIEAAWNIAKGADTNVGNYAPYFYYDVDTQKVSLITEFSYSNPLGAKLCTNSFTFEKFFNGFNNSFNANNVGYEYCFQIEKNPTINYYSRPGFVEPTPVIPTLPPTAPIPPPDPYFLIQTQNWRSTQLWASLIDIVFLTGSVPVTYEYTQSANSEGSAQFTPILTDFEPYIEDAGDPRSILSYFPQGPYRLIDLNSNTPLKRFDFTIFWKDKKGRLFPLVIPEGQNVNVKFLFIKKSTYIEEL